MTRDITPARDGDLPEIPAHQVESALRGHRPLGCAPEVSRAADLMNALRAPADRSELDGYQHAMDAFGIAFPEPRTRSTRIAMFSSVTSIRALASATGAAVALGAVATVLVTSGAMGPDRPVRVQPVATSSKSTTDGKSEKADPDKGKPKTAKTANGVGPDATGPAAVGLCNAWSNHPDKGRSTRSVAFRNLAEAAGGEGKIAAYCAKVPRPSDAADDESPETKGAKPSKTAKPSKPSKTAEATETAHPSQGAQTSTTHPSATSSSSSSSAGTTTPAPQSTTPGSTGTNLAPR